MSNQIGDWQTDVTFTHITYHDGFAFILGNRYPNGDFFQNHSQPWGDGVPGFGSLILGHERHRDPQQRDPGLGAEAVHRAVGLGRDVGLHLSPTRSRTATSTSTTRSTTPRIHNYPFITSNAAPKHRLVATGTFSGPWGIVLGAKLTLATPTPINSNACYFPNAQYPNGVTFPNGSVLPRRRRPRRRARAGSWSAARSGAYRDVDFQATKNFDLGPRRDPVRTLRPDQRVQLPQLVDYSLDITRRTGRRDGDLQPERQHQLLPAHHQVRDRCTVLTIDPPLGRGPARRPSALLPSGRDAWRMTGPDVARPWQDPVRSSGFTNDRSMP